MDIKIEQSWKNVLKDEFEKEYFRKLVDFVKDQYSKKHIYPPGNLIFSAFEYTPFDSVKVVILGQDPYHWPGQANGLSFSVNEGVPVPPSLKNIYRELYSDLGVKKENTGDLTSWAKQGVLLLNSTLTVEAKTPGSHQGKGWEEFTDAVIKILNEKKEHLVFILWGNYAKQKGQVIDSKKHLVITSSHPSPYSANYGFLGSKPFSKCNNYLTENNITPITW